VPTFAEFETYGEPLVVTDERRHVTTIWQARKTGGDNRLYIIKCYAPRVAAPAPGQSAEALEKDRCLEFLDGIKQIKKAQSEGGRNLAPIHALGRTESEAWYVTDHYPRNNLKAWVARRGGVDSAALRHVVESVVTGCLALKRSRGYSHGNLKPSNIFLVGEPRPLKKTPLVLTDAYPASPLQLASLGTTDRREVDELLGQVTEAQDLRNLGELLLQLVEGRLFSRSDDYNYPVGRSGIWDILGKDTDYWLKLCNQLVNPQLSLQTLNLESLAQQFRPSQAGAKAGLVLAGVAAICVLGGGAYFGIAAFHKAAQKRQLRQQESFEAALKTGQTAFDQKDYTAAKNHANEALAIRAGDPDATKLRDAAQTQLTEQTYQAEMAKGNDAFAQQDYSNALTQAQMALVAKPDDPAALTLKSKAQTQITAKVTRSQIQDALAAARNSEAAGNWTLAASQWQKAQQLGAAADEVGPGLAFANGLLSAREKFGSAQAQSGSGAAQARIITNLYGQALAALPQTSLWTASPERAAAVKAFTNEVALAWLKADTTMREAALTAEQTEQQYQQAITNSALHFAQHDYRDATNQAAVALLLKPNDPTALKLKDQAQKAAEKADMEARQRQKDYESATNSALRAFAKQDYQTATNQAARALQAHPGDSLARKILTDATDAAQTEATAAIRRENEYKVAMSKAGDALTNSQFEVATNQAARALSLKTNDAAALKLQKAAQDGLVAKLMFAQQQEQKYQNATNAAALALSQTNYLEAARQASIALNVRSNDAVALKIQSTAQAKLDEINQIALQQEKKYVAATNAASIAFANTNYTEALKQAQIAASIKTNDTVALRLQAAAQAKLDDLAQMARQQEQNYEAATNAAVAALAQGNFQDALIQAAKASQIRTNDAVAAQLKAAANQGLDLASAQASFASGDYANALQICQRYPNTADFNHLAGSVQTEQTAFNQNSQSLANGDYSFIQTLQAQSYHSKRPFTDLLTQGTQEQTLLNSLKQLKQSSQWRDLNARLAQAGAVTNKPPFKELLDLAARNDPLLLLNHRLLVLQAETGTEPRGVLVKDANGQPVKKLAPGTLLDAYYAEANDLEKSYKALNQLTPDVTRALKAARSFLDNF
jgi:hypothetical protein